MNAARHLARLGVGFEARLRLLRDRGACRTENVSTYRRDPFFPEKGQPTRVAKRICAPCPVRTECLEYALAAGERWGVWGGLSERERRRLKRRAS